MRSSKNTHSYTTILTWRKRISTINKISIIYSFWTKWIHPELVPEGRNKSFCPRIKLLSITTFLFLIIIPTPFILYFRTHSVPFPLLYPSVCNAPTVGMTSGVVLLSCRYYDYWCYDDIEKQEQKGGGAFHGDIWQDFVEPRHKQGCPDSSYGCLEDLFFSSLPPPLFFHACVAT